MRKVSKRQKQILDFLNVSEKMKIIIREVHNSDMNRKESDAEHVWDMLMIIYLFSGELESIDLLKTFKLILVHDLVEIYAGDTFAFDKKARENKKEREKVARDKLLKILPKDLSREVKKLFEEYENQSSHEAEIVKAIDKLQPIMQNLRSNGKSWTDHKITYKEIDDYKRKFMEKDKTLLNIYENLLELAKAKKYI